MYIAKQKRKENIAEYILYLWQLEDIFRALDFDGNAIFRRLIEPQENLSAEETEALFSWYTDMVNLMTTEGIREHGHLEHTLHLIGDLNDLHLQLLKFPVGEEYRKRYAQLAPELPALKTKIGKPEMNDIEICFRALYSVILYRLKGEKNEAVENTLALISPVIATLSNMHHKVEKGEIDLYKGVE